MRNQELQQLEGLVGEWRTTLSDAWFLEPPGTELEGTATIDWLGEAFLVMRWGLPGGETTMVIGRNDAQDQWSVLYHDERGVCRVFAMSWDDGHWTMSREDPDMHQRFIADVEPDRILSRSEMSEDQGHTWRKDFDLTFERA